MKRMIVKALVIASIVNILGTVPVSAAMPLEMSSERGNGDSWTITLKNVSGEDKADISLRACFYDADGRLKKVKNYGEADIRSGESAQTEMALPSMDFVYADAVKVLAWQGIEPQAEPVFLKGASNTPDEVGRFTDKELATVWMSSEDETIYNNGIGIELGYDHYINGHMYLGLRDMNELLGFDSYWDAEKQIVLFGLGETVFGCIVNYTEALLGEEEVELQAPPIIKDSRVLVPVLDIVKLFGYEVIENGGEVAIFDETASKIRLVNYKWLISDKFEGEPISEDITREELCSLVVRMYEKVKNKTIEPTDKGYSDTNDEDTLKAVSLGVIGGYADGSFAPDDGLKNSEAAIVLYRTMQELGIEIPDDYSDVTEFDDFKKNSGHWAESYVYGLKGIGVFDGVFRNTFGAEENISKKEAIALIANCYNIAK